MLKLEKKAVAENRHLMKISSIPSKVEAVKPFSKTKAKGSALELIQLHKMYCSLDGWDNSCLVPLGFKLLFVQIPQRSAQENHHKKVCLKKYGNTYRIGLKATLAKANLDFTLNNYTLAEYFNDSKNEPALRHLFHPKPKRDSKGVLEDVPPESFKNPLVIRKLIMACKYAKGKMDVYHWHRTCKMLDGVEVLREVKTILTHVNGIPLYNIYNLKCHEALKARVEKYAKRIATEGACVVGSKIVTKSADLQCQMSI